MILNWTNFCTNEKNLEKKLIKMMENGTAPLKTLKRQRNLKSKRTNPKSQRNLKET